MALVCRYVPITTPETKRDLDTLQRNVRIMKVPGLIPTAINVKKPAGQSLLEAAAKRIT